MHRSCVWKSCGKVMEKLWERLWESDGEIVGKTWKNVILRIFRQISKCFTKVLQVVLLGKKWWKSELEGRFPRFPHNLLLLLILNNKGGF